MAALPTCDGGRALLEQANAMSQLCSCACRVPVTTKSDPIIAITCVAHSSVDITAKPAVGGAAPELGDIQALVSQGEEEGMDEGLGSNSPGVSRVSGLCLWRAEVGLRTVLVARVKPWGEL